MNFASVNKIVTLAARVIDTKKSTEPIYEQRAQKPAFSKTNSAAPLKRVSPESVGIPSECIEGLLEKIFKDRNLNVHGMMILRGDKIICEASYGGYDFSYKRYTFSECKSIVALAIGCLIDEGKLSLDTRVVDILPKFVPAVARLKLKKLCVKDLLTMRATVEFAEADTLVEKDWRKGFFSSSTKGDIGETFSYNSLNTYILAAIITEICSSSMMDYLNAKIFEPLGIEGAFWEKSPEGIEKGGWGLYILTEDMAKIACLVMNKGVWKGKRIISEKFINDAVKPHVKTPASTGPFDYGYQIWCSDETKTFLFNGMFGQNAMGFLENGIIVLTIGGNNEMFQSCAYYRYILDAFDKPFGKTLKENKKKRRSLEKCIEKINNYYEDPQKRCLLSRFFLKKDLPADAYYLDKKRFEAKDPDSKSTGFAPMLMQIFTSRYTKGIVSLSFEIKNGGFFVNYEEKTQNIVFEVGFDSARITEIELNGEYYHIAAKGRFTENEDRRKVLVIRADLIEMPNTRYIKFFYEGSPYLKQYETPGGDYLSELLIKGKGDLSQNPAFGLTIGKVDDEYLKYKVDRVFAPDIKMELS